MSVNRIEITSVTPFADGATFSQYGAYERVDGFIDVALDPAEEQNRIITDLDLAPREVDSRVHARAPFILLTPCQGLNGNGRGSGRLLVDILNRGRRRALRFFNDTPDGPQSAPIDPGNGFLMRRGYTVAWCGWQHDIPKVSGNLGIEVPQARGSDGAPVSGKICIQFRTNVGTTTRLLSDREHQPYPAADSGEPDATLIVRPYDGGPGTVIARNQWQFAREVNDTVQPDPNHVFLKSGFEPGPCYEVTYTTQFAPVIGLGLAAIRDFTSFLRYGSADDGNPVAGKVNYAYAFGASQSGRFLRRFLISGLNLDEEARPVFDGIISHIAGGGSGEFNQRFGQPSSTAKRSIGNLFPFSDTVHSDDQLGLEASILDRQRKLGGVPKLFLTNTSTEYWRGDAALTHVSPDGKTDLEASPNVRNYHFAGTQHVAGSLPLTNSHPLLGKVRYPLNCVDYSPLLRAALVNLDAWCTSQTIPPDSNHPTLAEKTLEPMEDTLASLAALGVLDPPQHVPAVERLDVGPDVHAGRVVLPARVGEPYPLLTPHLNPDGNECAGITLADISVPLGTSTGWNLRHPEHGAGEQLAALAGAFFPFATTEQTRISSDSRPSIAARYANKDDFLVRTREAAEQLIHEGYLLAEDLEHIVKQAAGRYDALMN